MPATAQRWSRWSSACESAPPERPTSTGPRASWAVRAKAAVRTTSSRSGIANPPPAGDADAGRSKTDGSLPGAGVRVIRGVEERHLRGGLRGRRRRVALPEVLVGKPGGDAAARGPLEEAELD